MSLSLVQSRALLGLEAASVTVEVHLANGLPSFTLVGLADVEVKEARERVRAAIQNAGLEFPSNKRITVNLAPADLPKDSGRFDLPIALGILAAAGQIEAARLAGHEFAGELSLSGHLRPVRGALAMALALHGRGRRDAAGAAGRERARGRPGARCGDLRCGPPARCGAAVPAGRTGAGRGGGRWLASRAARPRRAGGGRGRSGGGQGPCRCAGAPWRSPRQASTAC